MKFLHTVSPYLIYDRINQIPESLLPSKPLTEAVLTEEGGKGGVKELQVDTDIWAVSDLEAERLSQMNPVHRGQWVTTASLEKSGRIQDFLEAVANPPVPEFKEQMEKEPGDAADPAEAGDNPSEA